MAGAGYKLFNTGDVLTAAQVNTYLMQQTVMVFASSAARTSALSGVLAEGMVSYLQDTNTLEVYDGSAWVGATGDITGLTAGTGISISSATGPVPTITNDVATEFDAKGDLVVGTGDNAFDRLPVGNSGETIVADSSTSTGLRYQGSITGGKNFAINGGMDIWQRGTSFAVSGSGYNAYTADRWTCYALGSGTISQDTSLSASGFRYGIKFTSSAASGGNDFYQLIETDQVIPLAGKQAALSGYCLAPNGKAPIMNLEYSTTVNDGLFGTYTQCTKTTISEPTATGSLLRYTYSFAIPTTAKTLRLRAGTGTLNNTEATTWTGIQLELGNVPTAFSRAGGNIAGELAACQRYYYRNTPGSAYGQHGFGSAYSTTQWQGIIQLPVSMRVTPTSIESGNVKIADGANTPLALTLSLVSSQSSPSVASVQAVVSGATQYRPYFLQNDNNTAGYVGFSAEL